ncbi:CidA/LrgA family protein [Noviherbaspirillum saxi]|uniref:CidA/LrgA family protein n=1 Tax=Noviherbaspirillum saxi TaxID=2320863 RepID=A0A3A3GD33_9BURK|nr:CidA/LrgA family protein [Noviherbaspirillum saxi]RJG00136.1 CidA/LrgA family protein [Noviherbaspirillum saxi]
MIHTFAILLLFQTVGETLAYAFSLPVPGPVIGMLLLFCFLIARPAMADKLAATTLEFLKHLSLLFIPAGVGIMVHAQRVASEWLPILAALLVSAIVSLVVTALVLKGLQK